MVNRLVYVDDKITQTQPCSFSHPLFKAHTDFQFEWNILPNFATSRGKLRTWLRPFRQGLKNQHCNISQDEPMPHESTARALAVSKMKPLLQSNTYRKLQEEMGMIQSFSNNHDILSIISSTARDADVHTVHVCYVR